MIIKQLQNLIVSCASAHDARTIFFLKKKKKKKECAERARVHDTVIMCNARASCTLCLLSAKFFNCRFLPILAIFRQFSKIN